MSCSSSDFCISGTSSLYDDSYEVIGTYDGFDSYSGVTNGYFIYYSTGFTQWCVSTTLGGPCTLFGPAPSVNDCPDIYSIYLYSGVCVTPTPSPTSAPSCLIDFDAIFDCDVPVTPTVTPTMTVTPTVTITPSSTNVCGGVSVNASITGFTPTPTPTITVTPTVSLEQTRPCNFGGVAKFNNVDGRITCANSKKFEDCFSGADFFTSQSIFDSNGYPLILGDVYGGFINGVSSCFIFTEIVDYVSGIDNVLITTEYGPSSQGKCLDCIPITKTPVSTSTPTPTPSSICPCNQFKLFDFNNEGETSNITYTDCLSNTVVTRTPAEFGTTTNEVIIICSKTTPTLTSGNCTIDIIDNCCYSNNCFQFYVQNNDPITKGKFTYIDCNTGLLVFGTVNGGSSIIICSISTPIVDQYSNLFVSVTGILCNTPTPTPTNYLTPTPTRTPTPTPSITKTLTPTPSSVSYLWTGGASWFTIPGNACLNYSSFSGGDWTTSTPVPTTSTSLIDNSTGLPITGQANNWIAISSVSNPGVVKYAVQVDVNGIIINVIVCP